MLARTRASAGAGRVEHVAARSSSARRSSASRLRERDQPLAQARARSAPRAAWRRKKGADAARSPPACLAHRDERLAVEREALVRGAAQMRSHVGEPGSGGSPCRSSSRCSSQARSSAASAAARSAVGTSARQRSCPALDAAKSATRAITRGKSSAERSRERMTQNYTAEACLCTSVPLCGLELAHDRRHESDSSGQGV